MMDFLAFPVEIRLKIYAHLLVHSEPIYLEKCDYLLPPRLELGERVNLYPGILRTSKYLYNEAVSLLYSNNDFHFLEEESAKIGHCANASLAFFLGQIGLLARHLRHVCISLPDLSTLSGTQIHEDDFKDLELIRDACVSITTLELSLPFTSGLPISTASLNLIDTRLKALPSLRTVQINVEWYSGDSAETSDDEAEDLNGLVDWNRPNGYLAAKLREYGWTVQITEVPLVKRVWTDPDDMIEFDNEDDYNDYMANVWGPREWQREQREADEIAYQRRLHGYAMGYADDGGPA